MRWILKVIVTAAATAATFLPAAPAPAAPCLPEGPCSPCPYVITFEGKKPHIEPAQC
jgi:hypothetical protein